MARGYLRSHQACREACWCWVRWRGWVRAGQEREKKRERHGGSDCYYWEYIVLLCLFLVILKNEEQWWKMQNWLVQEISFTQVANFKGKDFFLQFWWRMCFCIEVLRYGKKQTHVHARFLSLVQFVIKCRQAVLILTESCRSVRKTVEFHIGKIRGVLMNASLKKLFIFKGKIFIVSEFITSDSKQPSQKNFFSWLMPLMEKFHWNRLNKFYG